MLVQSGANQLNSTTDVGHLKNHLSENYSFLKKNKDVVAVIEYVCTTVVRFSVPFVSVSSIL